MQKIYTPTARTIQILLELQTGRAISNQELIGRFDADRKTAWRTIKLLQEFVPIKRTKIGREVFWEMDK